MLNMDVCEACHLKKIREQGTNWIQNSRNGVLKAIKDFNVDDEVTWWDLSKFHIPNFTSSLRTFLEQKNDSRPEFNCCAQNSSLKVMVINKFEDPPKECPYTLEHLMKNSEVKNA